MDEKDDGGGEGAGEDLVLPIDGTLDLHTFHPREVKELLPEYFAACLDKGIFEVRVVHGKGTGTMRKTVQSLLGRSALVESWQAADEGAGGWGATLVKLRRG